MLTPPDGLESPDLAPIIKEAITRSGVDVIAIAKACGVSRQAVYGWTKTGRIAKKHLYVLAELTHTSVDAFLSKDAAARIRETPGGYHPRISIRLFSENAYEAAIEVLSRHENVTSLTISPEWLRRHLPECLEPSRLRLMVGIGDTMKGLFDDGDTLIVDAGVTEAKADAVYALLHKGQFMIKRVQHLPNGGVLLMAENKSYTPVEISKRKFQEFRIIARVLKVLALRAT